MRNRCLCALDGFGRPEGSRFWITPASWNPGPNTSRSDWAVRESAVPQVSYSNGFQCKCSGESPVLYIHVELTILLKVGTPTWLHHPGQHSDNVCGTCLQDKFCVLPCLNESNSYGFDPSRWIRWPERPMATNGARVQNRIELAVAPKIAPRFTCRDCRSFEAAVRVSKLRSLIVKTQ